MATPNFNTLSSTTCQPSKINFSSTIYFSSTNGIRSSVAYIYAVKTHLDRLQSLKNRTIIIVLDVWMPFSNIYSCPHTDYICLALFSFQYVLYQIQAVRAFTRGHLWDYHKNYLMKLKHTSVQCFTFFIVIILFYIIIFGTSGIARMFPVSSK